MKAMDTGREPVSLLAMEQYEDKEVRLFQDEFAYRLLTPDMKVFVQLCRFPGFRKWIVSSAEKAIPGAYADILCRKRYFDQKIEEQIHFISAVIEIGAGYDSRSLRLGSKYSIRFIELDFAETMAKKREMIRTVAPGCAERICNIGIDFNKEKIDDLQELERLLSAFDKPVFYVMEAVTPYLTSEGIDSVFSYLSKAPGGSFLAFTYVDRDFIDGSDLMGWKAAYNKYVKSGLWKFGLSKEKVDGFLGKYGWTLMEDVSSEDVVSEEVLKKRGLQCSEVERFVFAKKNG